MLLENLVTNLRAYRVKKKMTQKILSNGAGYSLSYLSELERGNRQPTLEAIERFAKALGVHPLKLLSSP